MGVEELLDFALEEDAGFSGFVEDDEVKELLDFTLDEEDFAEELLLDLTLDEEFTEELDLSLLLLDESSVFTELELLESDESFDSFAELLDTSTGSDPMTLLEDLSFSVDSFPDDFLSTEDDDSSKSEVSTDELDVSPSLLSEE